VESFEDSSISLCHKRLGATCFTTGENEGKMLFAISFPSWLVVSTHLKNISQIGSSPQGGMKIKNI